jgi:hypothetical protein
MFVRPSTRITLADVERFATATADTTASEPVTEITLPAGPAVPQIILDRGPTAHTSALRGPVLVAGAGGFIGGHVVRQLVDAGHEVRAVDVKPLDEWFQHHAGVESIVADLSEKDACDQLMPDMR